MKARGVFGGTKFEGLVSRKEALAAAMLPEHRRKVCVHLKAGEYMRPSGVISPRDVGRANRPGVISQERLVVGSLVICSDGSVQGPPAMLAALRLWLREVG